MPSLEVWGPAVWTLFHTLAERVSEQAYPLIASQLFGQITKICKVLPCPDCATDASHFLAKVNISTLKTKTEFKHFVYLFHNYVNAKTRKKLFNVIHLDKYKNYKLIPVINNFLVKFNTKGNMNLINESFQRTFVKNHFKKWILTNIQAFVPPQQILVQETPEIKEASLVEEEASLVEEEASLVEEEASLVEEKASLVEEKASLVEEELEFEQE